MVLVGRVWRSDGHTLDTWRTAWKRMWSGARAAFVGVRTAGVVFKSVRWCDDGGEGADVGVHIRRF